MEVINLFCFGARRIPAHWGDGYRDGTDRLYIFDEPVTMCVNKQKIILAPHTLFYLPAACHVLPVKGKNSGIGHWYADFTVFPPFVAPCSFSVPFAQMSPAQRSALDFFEKLLNGGMEQAKIQGDFALISEVILFLVRAVTQQKGVATVGDEAVLFAIRQMHSEPLGTVTVENLAAAIGITPKTLIHRFSKAIGTTPYAYYKQLRARVAEQMRRHGATVETAAEFVGYSEASALIHALKNKNSSAEKNNAKCVPQKKVSS